jgi:hypothetical protein
MIQVAGPEHWLSAGQAVMPTGRDLTADAIIAALLDAAPLRRPALAGRCIIDDPAALIDGTAIFPAENAARALEPGKSSFAYCGAAPAIGLTFAQAIDAAAASERGRFFTDRAGQFVFYNRHRTMLNSTRAATFADDMTGLEARYGAAVVNRVTVRFWPRAVGPAGTALWTLPDPQRLRAGDVRVLTARYRDVAGEPVAALEVIAPQAGLDYQAAIYAADGTPTDTTGQVRVRLRAAGADAARLEVRNMAPYALWITALRLRGTPLSGGDPVQLEAVDGLSATHYGPGALALDLPLLTHIEEAAAIAHYELVRQGQPRTIARELRLDARRHPAARDRTLFDRIGISEAQTGHAADYTIIAEHHRVTLAGSRHHITWLLEPVDSSRFVVIDESQIDGPNWIVPY